MRAREESVGVIESPSERSARMTLFADLASNRPMIAIAPVTALRQYVMPRALFEERSFTLAKGDEPGFDDLQERLYELGYHRADVVSAAGEFAVRGGILDVWTATEDCPSRLDFFGDEIESLRTFDLGTQRSTGRSREPARRAVERNPRDEAYRDRVSERLTGTPATISAARAFIAGGADLPEAWLSLAFDERETLLDYFSPDGLVVLEEPAMLATIERGLEEERSREEEVLLAAVESGELSVDEDAVGEALLATSSPRIRRSRRSRPRSRRGARSSSRAPSKARVRRGCRRSSNRSSSKRVPSSTSTVSSRCFSIRCASGSTAARRSRS